MPAVRLTPCSGFECHQNDVPRQEQLGLPEEWIRQFRNAPGRWIHPDEYFWTPDGFFDVRPDCNPALIETVRSLTGGAFYALTLAEQCELLGVRYQRTTLEEMADGAPVPPMVGKRGGMPVEEFVLQSFQRDGWIGDRCEGAAFYVIDFIVQKTFEAKGLNYLPFDRQKGYAPIDRKEITAEDIALLTEVIGGIGIDLLKKHHDLWVEFAQYLPIPKTMRHIFTTEMLLSAWRRLDIGFVHAICERTMLGYGVAGWADITLFKPRQVKFIEVKQPNDKFTHRQAYWVRNIAKPLGLDHMVMHIVKNAAR